MANKKGKDARPARPLRVSELLALCDGSVILAGKLLNVGHEQYLLGNKNFSKSTLGVILGLKEGVSKKDVQKILAKIDENRATRVLRDMSKKMAALPAA
jgi:hypothetical protein